MKTMLSLLATLFLICRAGAQPSLMAWYPLNGTPNDTTEQYGPMTLTNTPFQQGGGILCSGVYINSGLPDACEAQTPAMPLEIFKGYTLMVQFKSDAIASGTRPVLVGGSGWRWMAINVVADGAVELSYNNGSTVVKSAHTYAVDAWHQAAMTYDSARGIGCVYMDGELACTASFALLHGPSASDRTFSINDRGRGLAFKGMIKDLKIFSSPDVVDGIPPQPASVQADGLTLRNYPQPFAARTTIAFRLPQAAHAIIRIYDILGHERAQPADAQFTAGDHSVSWNAAGLPAGLYLVRITAGPATATKFISMIQ
jgi:hypothetical protein